jgi:hypothetical protein
MSMMPVAVLMVMMFVLRHTSDHAMGRTVARPGLSLRDARRRSNLVDPSERAREAARRRFPQ